MKFSNTLIIGTYKTRDLPWRGTTNPAIWLSKSCFNKLALLKVPYFLAFSCISCFDLAEANEEEC
jgi:hypothetical protein